MSAAAAAAGPRRFALQGKGWTLVLGTLLAASYLRYQASHEKARRLHTAAAVEDENGNVLHWHDSPPTPSEPLTAPEEAMEMIAQARDMIGKSYLPYALAGGTVAWWVRRSYLRFYMLMEQRYADVTYQLLRPNVLQNKIVAWKILGLGGLIPLTLGAGTVAALYYASPSREQLAVVGGEASREALGLRVEQFAKPLSESRFAEFSSRVKDMRQHLFSGDTRNWKTVW